jgi:Predicted Co/Zn/Cd cation transporters
MTPRFGRTELPAEAREALRRARRLEWVTIGYLAVTIVAVRLVSKPPTEKYPYGLHRSVGIGHLVAALALLSMGGFLVVDAASGLVTAEHPPIGTMTLFGVTFWAGWAMVAVMALTIPLPIVFGRKKMELAEQLHDKVLYADADMNKADWMTAAGSIVGVLGIGIGWWWADAAAALFISGSILWDGVKNLRAAITDLIDHRARTYDGEETHPVVGRLEELLRGLPWVAEAGARVRDEGHVFHAEAFVVPRGGRTPSLKKLVAAREACEELDWKLHDVTVVLVDELPEEVVTGSGGSARGRGR